VDEMQFSPRQLMPAVPPAPAQKPSSGGPTVPSKTISPTVGEETQFSAQQVPPVAARPPNAGRYMPKGISLYLFPLPSISFYLDINSHGTIINRM